MTSTNDLSRLLTLIPYLHHHPGSSAAEVAAALGTTEKQIIKDLHVLWFCGPSNLPGQQFDFNMHQIETGGPIDVINGDDLRRPLRFSGEESLALRVALIALASVVTADQRSVVASALAKLDASQPGPGVAVAMVSGTDEVREALLAAISAGERVRLSYDGVARAATTTPEVDPLAVVVRDGYAYLRAWSLTRADWRTYRLDRIVEVTSIGRSEDHGAPPELGQGWFASATGEPVTVLLAPQARWVTEYDPVMAVEPADQGRVRATFQVVDPAWFAQRLLQLGNGVLEIDPPSADAAARETARAGLDLYAQIG